MKKIILHDQYLLGRYPKLGGQSRISFSVSIFSRFIKNDLGVTNFETLQSDVIIYTYSSVSADRSLCNGHFLKVLIVTVCKCYFVSGTS